MSRLTVKKYLFNTRPAKLYRLARQAYRDYTLQLVVLIALGFLGGFLEGVGINALIPMFSFVTGSKGTDKISIYLEKLFSVFNLTFSLRTILIFITIIFILKAITLFIIQFMKIRISTSYQKSTMHELFSRTMRADWSYLLNQRIGQLTSVIMIDTMSASGLLKHLSMVIIIITGMTMYVIIALNINAMITLGILCIAALLTFIIKPLFYKTRKASVETTKQNRRVAHYVDSHMLGLKTIKSMHLSKTVIRSAAAIFERLRILAVRKALYKEMTSSLIEPISIIIIILLFAISYKTPGFNIASFAAIIYLINKIFSYTQQLLTNIHGINTKVPHLQQVLRYQEEAKHAEENTHGGSHFKFDTSLEFQEVVFKYASGNDILKNVSFKINKGEMVGIIGKSGAGKTTIVDLLLRLFNPRGGSIALDGTAIQNIDLKEWRDNISYVSQDMFLINDTIRNNIALYDKGVTDLQIIEAAKLANALDIINEKKEELDTIVGERGTLLSVGQRQRIILTRALVRKPSLLILDEATSAVDNESEQKIKHALEGLKGTMTIITVAHRLSTIRTADRLLVLDKGMIIEQGSPDDLLKNKKSYFYQVYTMRE